MTRLLSQTPRIVPLEFPLPTKGNTELTPTKKAKFAKKPRLTKEQKAQQLIAKGARSNGKVDGPKLDLVLVNVRFDRDLLARIDADAKEHGQNRTAYIVMATHEKLKRSGVVEA